MRDPAARIPWAAVAAAVLALPCAFVLVVVGWAALVLADARADGGVWTVLFIDFAWLVGLLVGAIRLLLARGWFGLAFPAGLLAALMIVGLVRGGLGSGLPGFNTVAALVSLATAVLAALPAVRGWVARRRRERLYPGSTQPSPSRP
jgi:hypothetical protein